MKNNLEQLHGTKVTCFSNDPGTAYDLSMIDNIHFEIEQGQNFMYAAVSAQIQCAYAR